MNMIEAVKSVLSQYVGFRGRARRSEFWYWYLATLIASFIIAILEMLMGLGSDGSGPLSSILTLALFLPTLSVAFRRLHDTGRSGWWIGGFYIAIFAGVAVFLSLAFSVGVDGSDGATAGLGLFGIAFVIGIVVYAIAMLVFFCQDSQPGPNKYGSNPKDEGNFDVFG